MQIEQVHYRFKAHATYGFGVLARFVVVLFSATMLLAFSATMRAQQAAIGRTAIRSFRVHVPQHALDDLRRRIANTRWPDRETVSESSQGVHRRRERPRSSVGGRCAALRETVDRIVGRSWVRIGRRTNAARV